MCVHCSSKASIPSVAMGKCYSTVSRSDLSLKNAQTTFYSALTFAVFFWSFLALWFLRLYRKGIKKNV